MRLQPYLSAKKLGYREFGQKRRPNPVPKSTIRQWALGLRYPKSPDDMLWLEEVTDGHVTAKETAEHCAEVRRGAIEAGLSRAAFVQQQRVAA